MLKNLLGSLVGSRSRAADERSPAPPPPEPRADARARALALCDEGRYGAALRSLRDDSGAKAADPGRRLDEAQVLARWGRLREAAAVGLEALGAGDVDARGWADMATLWIAVGDPARALSLARSALARAPDDREVASSLAAALLAGGHVADGIAAWARLAESDPTDLRAWLGQADGHTRSGDLAAARRCLERALEIAPQDSRAWLHLGAIDVVRERYDDAFRAFGRAEASGALDPAGNAFANHAIALFHLGRWHECRERLEAGLPARPDLNGHMQLGPTLLALGEFDEGWKQYEFRWLNGRFAHERPAWTSPHWDGQDLAGRTILIVREQGIGDLFQFSRYFPLLKARGARVVFQPFAGMRGIAERLPGVDVLLDEGDVVPPHDYFAFLLSLPRAFGTRIDTIPPCAPPLTPRPDYATKWGGRLGAHDRPRIGVVWAGRPEHARDRQRSIALDVLAPLLDIAGARFIGLQKGAAVVQAEAVPERVDWSNLGPEFDDLDDAAAVIAALDLVVTVDTALAHLAGIMGKPVWMLVADPPDFRWLLEGDDTPWYPTMRLVRQEAPGDWTAPVRRLAQDVGQWVRQWHAARSSSRPPPLPAPAPARTVRVAPKERRVPGLMRALPTRSGFVEYDPDEPLVGASIEHYGEWLAGLGDAAVSMAVPGAVVIEASPGIGMHAIPLAQRIGRDGHLLLHEPRPVIRRVLGQNLGAHRLTNATLLARRLGGPAASTDADTVDDLGLDRLDGLKGNDGSAALAIVEGAQETLWRCRPWLLLTVPDDGALVRCGARVREFGYRTWRLRTRLVSPANFARRDDDVFGGRVALAVLALPEERGARVAFPDCTEIA